MTIGNKNFILNSIIFLKVNLTLSTAESKPNSTVNLTIASRPLSYVGLLGVDQSVLLLKSGNDIDLNMITNELNSYLPVEQYNYDWQESISYSSYKDFTVTESIIFTNSNPEYSKFIILGFSFFKIHNC